MTSGLTLQTRLVRGAFTLDLDLTLPGRGLTALFGASGSGKTTCLRVLAGLEPAASGRLSVGGELWQDSARGLFVPPHQRALGYVFQEASLFDHLSVQDNIRFGYRRTPAAQRRYGWDHGLELLGIGHLLQRMPHELSGGERQRVAMARALATSPRVLLMDEPLAALDAPRKAEILPWLEQLHQKLDIPVVYVTHSADEVARLADHLVLLEQGRVMAQGPVLELMTRTDLPLAHGDSAGALVEAVTCGLQSDSDLCELRFDGGTLLLPQTRATPLPDRTPVRVRIQARDVSLSLVLPEQTSVLNCLPATVSDVCDDGPGQVLVGLRLGLETRLLSRISRLSCERLGITTGLPVYAQIKGVAMVR
ncbi:MAG: molybdenum ABC transporter ATP-binding protein [Gammaproteobacteria bacterium]|uniref:molybdenum ABC transporter ATP-binding protein n=1 Tax=Hydrogenophaga sp. TaxID=1904254 RepID=UPI0025BBBD17|nr:molybdenum ABC transporter ATP-binding protein [Hydrogenophaga sp.]MBU4183426.1 molybdenum ABC transporter ATP-binding protein [Gammaproteobacteria bacterium]MBU4281974.1 molybdenum ABC transporter ATP-binding protein [Gammaproteobacteria bacterium]MBU4323497.1 molybdenum ABC transporter ATP-binding protein [Gammaproteobacteria bacterium]MBU4507677.1 molybdenum ABC transporter ATP-binding protein [Gammaproteobacteria bacterium]MCG2658397.1 molybdenum ABC transporter ATP-binding protein [Hyd